MLKKTISPEGIDGLLPNLRKYSIEIRERTD